MSQEVDPLCQTEMQAQRDHFLSTLKRLSLPIAYNLATLILTMAQWYSGTWYMVQQVIDDSFIGTSFIITSGHCS